jgi:hypothetical protein
VFDFFASKRTVSDLISEPVESGIFLKTIPMENVPKKANRQSCLSCLSLLVYTGYANKAFLNGTWLFTSWGLTSVLFGCEDSGRVQAMKRALCLHCRWAVGID